MSDRIIAIKARCGEDGFTLLELLVAATLLGFLTVLMLGGLRLSTRSWARTETTVAAVGEIEVVQDVLQQLISQAYPALRGSDATNYRVDFDGWHDNLSFLAPLPNNIGNSEIVRVALHTVPRQNASDLVMSWRLDRGARAPLFPAEKWSDVVLLKDIAGLTFTYFGAEKLERQARWRDSWEDMRTLPQLVKAKIEFTKRDRRSWPELVVRPMVDADAGCVYDVVSRSCRGRE